jgi:hypothetical protein
LFVVFFFDLGGLVYVQAPKSKKKTEKRYRYQEDGWSIEKEALFILWPFYRFFIRVLWHFYGLKNGVNISFNFNYKYSQNEKINSENSYGGSQKKSNRTEMGIYEF